MIKFGKFFLYKETYEQKSENHPKGAIHLLDEFCPV